MKLRPSLVAGGLAATLVLTACSGGGSDTDSPTSPSNQGNNATGAALTVAKPDGPITTEGNNPWVGDSSALRLGYANAIFEPLAIVNLVDPSADVVPWLASAVEWADDFTSVKVTARDGVTWNDGEAFTADDIAFTFQLIQDNEALDTAALEITSVTTEGDTVEISFANSMFVKQDKVLHRLIVPEHIWASVDDPTTHVNENPVGTGPYVLSNFSTQAVELTARTDYWGGELAVPTLYYVSYADNTALTTALANGDADWAQAFIPNVQSAYLDKDPDHNVYWAAAGLGIDTMFVNTTTKPFNDVAFRKAVNMVIDRQKHMEIAREGGVPALTSVTGLPTPAGDAFISSQYAGQEYSVDVDGARAVLEAAGYTWNGDTLIDPDGDEVTFTLSVPQGWNDYVTGISLISDSVKELGVTAAVDTPDADSWWAAKSDGEFDAILHWTDSGATPYDLYSNQMDGRFLAPIGEGADFNFGRFDDSAVTTALQEYANTTDDAVRDAALDQIQTAFVEQVPAMPIGTRPFISQYNTRNYVGWPGEDDPYVPADPTQPTAVYILTKLRPAD
ncbi:peptide/nickel transport system substrate-binding protein [Micrococcales bacterium KH10]|nr:peptide/nickel transport system substrate-binding protein [Micrococcales bacterium KH10]